MTIRSTRNESAGQNTLLSQFIKILIMIGGLITVLSFLGGIIFYIAPLKDVPTNLERMQAALNDIGKVQAVQAESMKTLTEVISDTKVLRRDVDRNTSDISAANKRLDKLDSDKLSH